MHTSYALIILNQFFSANTNKQRCDVNGNGSNNICH